jgi:putative acetyltransferase
MCGCYKEHDDETIEIKRMYVDKNYRGKGISKMLLYELEKWAIENEFEYAILETSIHFEIAQSLYKNVGYYIIDNYDQYEGLEESACMKKKLK